MKGRIDHDQTAVQYHSQIYKSQNPSDLHFIKLLQVFLLVTFKRPSLYDCISHIKDSRIFIGRSHGGSDYDSTWIKLSGISIDSKLDSSIHIYDFSEQIRLTNFDGVELLAFVGCKTAVGGNTGENLITASVNCGAEYALGFQDDINCNGANTWVVYFYENYTNEQSVYDSARNAADDTAADHFVLDFLGELNTDLYCIAEQFGKKTSD